MNPAQLLPLLSRFAPLAGLVAVLAIVWLVGPTLAFGEARPLVESWQRWLATGLVLFFALLWWIARWLWTRQRAQKLEDGVAGSGEREVENRLKAGFAALRRKRAAGAVLAMPWYAVIGPPGTGKTTAIRASGLHFVDRDLVGAEAYQGVGGTRHCNWWLAEDAVLIDTAGRYSHSEAPSAADEGEWRQFLATLKRFRPERPVNGVLVFFGLDQLAAAAEGELSRIAASVSARTREISHAFGLALPVYVVFTKLDRLAGFRELFEDIGDADSRRSLGFALDDVREPVRVREAAMERLGHLVRRIEQWTHGQVQAERNLPRTAHMISAPSQLLTLAPRIAGILERLAIDSGEGRYFALRGTYLISSVQEGSLFDRIAQDLGAAFGIAAGEADGAGRGSRALFVEGVFRDAVLPEARLAGSDPRAVRRGSLLRIAASVGVAAVGLAAALGLTLSFGVNRGLVGDFSVATTTYREVASRSREGSDVAGSLDRLEALAAVVAVAERYEPTPPLRVSQFLYQGAMLGENAGDVYDRELSVIVGQRLRLSLEQGLRRPDAESLTRQFEWLKAYLMLDAAYAGRRDGGFVQRVATDLWGREYAATPTVRDRLLAQLAAMFERGMHSQTLDAALVEQIRARVAGGGTTALAAFVYRSFQTQLVIPDGRDLSLGGLLGVDGTRLFGFAPNWNAESKIPALHTRPGAVAFTNGLDAKLREFSGDAWVLGEYMPAADVLMGPQVREEIRQSYAREYIRTWEAVLHSVTIAPGDTANRLAVAASHSTSPIAIFLRNVLPHIDLPLPAAGDASPTPAGDAAGDPRKLINAHPGFVRLAASIRGDGAPSLGDFMAGLQNAAANLGVLQQSTGAGSEGLDTMRAVAMTTIMGGTHSAAFPPPLSTWHASLMGGAIQATQAIVKQGEASEVKAKGAGACTVDVAGLYPFERSGAQDISPDRFAELFAPTGSLETFLRTDLAGCIDTRASPWRWGSVCSLRASLPAMAPVQFERARRIREAFFSGSGDRIQVEFELTPVRIVSKDVDQVVIHVGHETLVMAHGPPLGKKIVWQANGDVPMPVEIEFKPHSGVPVRQRFDGAWSLLHWLDAYAQGGAHAGEVELNMVVEGYSAVVRFQSRRIESLLADAGWRSFRCPM